MFSFAFSSVAEIPLSGSLYMPVLQVEPVPILAQTEEGGEFPGGEEELFDSGIHRDLKTAFLLSMALPGAGEFYAGNKIKAATFLALEAGVWTGFILYNKKGNDGEDDYRVFANEHWEYRYYYEWFHSFGDDSIYTEQLPVTIEVNSSDTTSQFSYTVNDTTFHADQDHDYYEMIGKYDWFLLGWEDLPNRDAIRESTLALSDVNDILGILKNHEYDSPLRLEYMDMRKQTNDYFEVSKYFIGAAIFNHLLSAFDAAWTAKRANDRVYEGFTLAPELEAQVGVDSRGKPVPKIVINLARF